jgi:uncharacterized protein (DUF1499 family)
MTRVFHALVVLSGSILLAGCHGARPTTLGVRDGRLAPCPASPNCVSSQDPDDAHHVDALTFTGAAATAMGRLAGILRSLPRASVVATTETYLHAEFRSAIFRFVDDVEFLADEDAGVIHIRSASRVGRSDLGVNRKRVETIRTLGREAGAALGPAGARRRGGGAPEAWRPPGSAFFQAAAAGSLPEPGRVAISASLPSRPRL